MTLSQVLDTLRTDPAFMRCVTAWERLPASPARTAPWPEGLTPRLVALLREQGIDQPYSHQAQAMAATLAGQHVVLSTTTASGKTLAYTLPTLSTLLNDPAACALYLFPTKALAHDQIAGLKEMIGALEAPIALRPYDGDTPSSRRPAIRKEARLLVSNPDMLHTGILPHHTRWARFFGNLQIVVLDEVHTYRGIFGSHVANVLRRLLRVCRFYGSEPRFMCTSATIANPQQLAERLIEAPVTLIDDDGAPRGEKHILLYNPPLVDAQLGIRRSATFAAQEIAARFIDAHIQTIVFARARLTTEVLLTYLRDQITAAEGDPQSVQGYRGGYLPHERRQIERGLRAGQIRGVVATNALELGIDIGQLDACIMAGYPGTIASAWQQAGRAGRRAGQSAAILVASAMPLDQYLVTHPHYFFGQPVEQALMDPDNLAVLTNHLACAAFELPFEQDEPFGTFDAAGTILEELAAAQVVHHSKDRYTWIGEGYPAAHISLRTNTAETIVIQDDSQAPPQAIGQMDRPSAPQLIHEGAVYLHAGATYVVDQLDWEDGLAHVRAADLDYYTRASSVTEAQVLTCLRSSPPENASPDPPQPVTHAYGELLVTTRATGYRKIKRYTHETLAWAPIDLPEQTLHTLGYWLTLSESLTDALQQAGVLPPRTDYGPDWPTQREATRARDQYRCRQCGAAERPGRQHDVHHIIPFRTFGYIPGQNQAYQVANQLDNLITLCAACHRRVERTQGARGALSGLAYLLRNLAPLHLMCDPGDLGSTVQAHGPQGTQPTVTLYDNAPGGTGLSIALYENHQTLLAAAWDVVRTCPCEDGCPACTGPAGETAPQAKDLARRLLEAIIEESH